MQTTRQFEIIYILLHKKKVSAKDLAERFGVSTRTIYRDIDALSVAGIPVYTEQGKGGGIALLPDFVLDKSLLNEQEQNEILTALHGLSLIKAGEAEDLLKRLSTIFNKTATDWLKVDFSDWSYANNYFNELKSAILARHIVEFAYYNSHSQKSRRRIEPVQLWFKSQAWYVKGYCLTKQDFRTYRLSRIKDLVITDEKFALRNVIEKFGDEQGSPQEMQEYSKIKLQISPEMAYRVFDDFDESRIEIQPDGSYIVTASWSIDSWVHGYILSFGEHIEVLEPSELKDIISEKIKKMSKKYF